MLGFVDFECQGLLRYPNYSEASRGQEDKIERIPEMDMALMTLTRVLLEALALALLDICKPFHLYVDERRGSAKGVFAQTLGL